MFTAKDIRANHFLVFSLKAVLNSFKNITILYKTPTISLKIRWVLHFSHFHPSPSRIHGVNKLYRQVKFSFPFSIAWFVWAYMVLLHTHQGLNLKPFILQSSIGHRDIKIITRDYIFEFESQANSVSNSINTPAMAYFPVIYAEIKPNIPTNMPFVTMYRQN